MTLLPVDVQTDLFLSMHALSAPVGMAVLVVA